MISGGSERSLALRLLLASTVKESGCLCSGSQESSNMDFSFLFQPEMLAALFTLTVLEIVLGIDNIIFISILAGKLPAHQQGRARTIGLAAAMITRLALLFSLTWIMKLTTPLFEILGHGFSGRDLILLCGGLFLIWKSATEIYEKVEAHGEKERGAKGGISFAGTIVQIMILDIVFSLDSVITAVGMSNNLMVMCLAVIIAVGVMMLSSGAISTFITKHPSIKLLALSFLLMIGVVLIGEGMGQHISKGYIYCSMAFAFAIEILNIRMRRKSAKKDLDEKKDEDTK